MKYVAEYLKAFKRFFTIISVFLVIMELFQGQPIAYLCLYVSAVSAIAGPIGEWLQNEKIQS